MLEVYITIKTGNVELNCICIGLDCSVENFLLSICLWHLIILVERLDSLIGEFVYCLCHTDKFSVFIGGDSLRGWYMEMHIDAFAWCYQSSRIKGNLLRDI